MMIQELFLNISREQWAEMYPLSYTTVFISPTVKKLITLKEDKKMTINSE